VLTCFQNGTHYQFEQPKSSQLDAGTVDEWIEALERAKDLAMSQDLSGYNSDNGFGEMSSSMSPSPASTLSRQVPYPEGGFSIADRSGRNQLSKSQASLEESQAKRNRFSKRQSKNGLGTAAF
jgi:3-phosphoinositide dependent protein kinase-1